MTAPVLKFVLDVSRPRFKDLDRVRLLRDVSTDSGVLVPAVSTGTVVGVWADGAEYEVEFADYPGLVTIEASGLELASRRHDAEAADD